MKKVYKIGDKFYTEAAEHNRTTNGEVYRFTTYLQGYLQSEQTTLDKLSRYQLDRLFCRYQCFCVNFDYEYEAAELYGLKGLFG